MTAKYDSRFAGESKTKRLDTQAMSAPSVSVVMPTFNRAARLPNAIDSVLAQTMPDFELIIVDDGSTDDTANVVRRYADARIEYRYQENQGQSAARNTALGIARGEFICFLDSDDSWFPEKLREQLSLMRADPDASVLYGNEIYVDADGKESIHGRHLQVNGDISHCLVLGNFIDLNTTMIRRKALPEPPVFDPALRAGEDYDLWLRLSITGRFIYADRVWARYALSGNRVSDDFETVYRNNLRSLQQLFAAVPSKFPSGLMADAFCRLYLRRGREHAARSQWRAALKDYSRALRIDWRSRMVWRAVAKLILLRR